MEEEKEKKGYIGKLADVDIPYFYYCNEKDSNRKGFLFKCCEGCQHNPLPGQLQKKVIKRKR